jgi:hypothetical protein
MDSSPNGKAPDFPSDTSWLAHSVAEPFFSRAQLTGPTRTKHIRGFESRRLLERGTVAERTKAHV